MKKKLLIVSATYVAEENRKKLRELGRYFHVGCATTRSGETFGQASNVSRVESRDGFDLRALETIGAPQTTTRYILRGLGRMLREERYDVIVVESEPWAWIRWQTWWWKRVYQPRALFGEFSWENMERSGIKGFGLGLIYRAAVRTGDFAIVGNEEAGKLFRRRGITADRLLISPQLGVDEAVFRPADADEQKELRGALAVPRECFLVGYCGRLEEFKGVLELVEAAGLAREDCPHADLQLALMGNGSLRGQLEKLRQSRPWLHLVAPRPHSRVAEFMRALDLFVLPSRETRTGGMVWKEQFGHVLIEAMACGVATIGSDSGAIPEVIGSADRLFAEGDARALALILAKLRDDVILRRSVAEAGLARVLKNYTNSAIAGGWAAFLEGLR